MASPRIHRVASRSVHAAVSECPEPFYTARMASRRSAQQGKTKIQLSKTGAVAAIDVMPDRAVLSLAAATVGHPVVVVSNAADLVPIEPAQQPGQWCPWASFTNGGHVCFFASEGDGLALTIVDSEAGTRTILAKASWKIVPRRLG